MAEQLTALQRAVNFLSRREHSQQELRAKLAKRDHDEQEIELAITRLVENGLQSDERFTESYVQSRIERGHGPAKISAELRQRGIDDSLIASAIENDNHDWLALAQQSYIKKYGDDKPADYRETSRRLRFLQQRGFSSEQCRETIERQT